MQVILESFASTCAGGITHLLAQCAGIEGNPAIDGVGSRFANYAQAAIAGDVSFQISLHEMSPK